VHNGDVKLNDGTNDDIDKKVNNVCKTWLDTAELPKELGEKFERSKTEVCSNSLLQGVDENFEFWKNENSRKRKKSDRTILAPNLTVSEQLILLLERMLSSDLKLSFKVLKKLDTKFKFSHANADVQHRLNEFLALIFFPTLFSCLLKKALLVFTLAHYTSMLYLAFSFLFNNKMVSS